jgi:type I restriction enzyme S subunit
MGVWETETLANLCNMYQPKTISKKDMTDDGDYPVYGANGIIGRYNSYNHDSPQLLVTCRGATCGSVNITSGKVWINGNAMVIAPKDERLVLSYLEYFFRGAIDLSKVISGAAQPQITRQGLSPVTVDYPPIPEQQRIVAILDQAFADIEKARANAEKNLKNARELFDSYLNQVLSGESNGMGWGAKKLSEVCTHIFAGGDVPKDRLSRYKTSDYQVPIFSNGEKNKGLYGFTDVPRVHDASITVSARGTIGYSEIRYEPFLPVVRLIVLTPNPEMVTLGFLNYAIKGIGFVNSGSSIPQLTVPMIKEYKCILPSIPEQQLIVASLDKLSEKVQQLEKGYQEKLNSLDELKKSLLQKAFSGELTKTEGHAA